MPAIALLAKKKSQLANKSSDDISEPRIDSLLIQIFYFAKNRIRTGRIDVYNGWNKRNHVRNRKKG